MQFFVTELNDSSNSTRLSKKPQEKIISRFEFQQEYPLLAYKDSSGGNLDDNMISVVNLAKNIPHMRIHLDEFKFLKFVQHEQMLGRLFDDDDKHWSYIMFLVKQD